VQQSASEPAAHPVGQIPSGVHEHAGTVVLVGEEFVVFDCVVVFDTVVELLSEIQQLSPMLQVDLTPTLFSHSPYMVTDTLAPLNHDCDITDPGCMLDTNGFTNILAGGREPGRESDGSFSHRGVYSHLWSSIGLGNYALKRDWSSDYSPLGGFYGSKKTGASIRCLKD